MKISLFALALGLALPSFAQTPIPAPAGWKTQRRANGATTFTPLDLRAGETYSITTYASAPLGGKTPEAYLRGFSGTVGTKPGQLTKPLQIGASTAQGASATGIYRGPTGTELGGVFAAFSLDGGRSVAVLRILFSGDAVFTRYKGSYETLLGALAERAKTEAGEGLMRVPEAVSQKLTPGGALQPGVYAGNQYEGEKLKYRFRLYLYPGGKYQFKDENAAAYRNGYGALMGQGASEYNAATGQLSFGLEFNLLNDPYYSAYCYYGRNSAGKPAILGYFNFGFAPFRTYLTRVGPIPAPPKPTAAQLGEIAKGKQEAAERAERDRYPWTTAPGRGVKNAQIAAILCNSLFMNGGMNTDTYLLLKDGSIRADLPVAPDELDVARSKAKEPDKWGRWRKNVKGDYLVAWNGGKWESLDGFAVVPAPAQTKLQGRWGAGRSTSGPFSSFALWGVSFDRRGRFARNSRGGTSSFGLPDANGNRAISSSGYDQNGSSVGASGPGYAVGSETRRKNPNGNNEGTYSLSGWVLTLRYDSGRVVRLPFFFFDSKQETLFFEGDTLAKDSK